MVNLGIFPSAASCPSTMTFSHPSNAKCRHIEIVLTNFLNFYEGIFLWTSPLTPFPSQLERNHRLYSPFLSNFLYKITLSPNSSCFSYINYICDFLEFPIDNHFLMWHFVKGSKKLKEFLDHHKEKLNLDALVLRLQFMVVLGSPWIEQRQGCSFQLVHKSLELIIGMLLWRKTYFFHVRHAQSY